MRTGLGFPTRLKRNSKAGLERTDLVNFFDQVVFSLNRDGFVKLNNPVSVSIPYYRHVL